MTPALRQCGLGDGMAGPAARTRRAAFQHAVQAWADDPMQSLDAYLLRAFGDLRAFSAAGPLTRPGSEH